MILSKERLYQIIQEEVEKRLFEQEEEDYRQMSRRSLMKKMGAGALAAGGFGAAGATLGSALEQDREARAARRRDIQRISTEEANTLEAKLEEFENYINNPAAFRWAKGEESMMTLPGTIETDDAGIKRGITVLPPSYSIAVIAMMDKRAGNPRFPPPAEQVNFTDSNATEAKYNLDNFFYDFPPSYGDGALNPDYLGTETLTGITGVRKYPASGLERATVLMEPELLLSTPDYILPENGLTIKQYYNWLYYNQFLSAEEISNYDYESQEGERMRNLFKTANPGAWERLTAR
tara:strand:- start:4126 stop:5001 length:876 start_codon:yes stop_codon:yes gene_type:complete